MKTNLIVLSALMCISLACSLTEANPAAPTAQPAASSVSPSPRSRSADRETGKPPVIRAASEKRCIVSSSVLHLRACDGTQCAALAWLPQGEPLRVLRAQDLWIEVKTESGQTGWVHSKYCVSGE